MGGYVTVLLTHSYGVESEKGEEEELSLYSRGPQLHSSGDRFFPDRMEGGLEHCYKSFVQCKLTSRFPNRLSI